MYIEKKGNYTYLVKKNCNKKITINIGNQEQIIEDNIKLISEKEFDFLKGQIHYKNFQNELFNKDLLDKVLVKSIFFGNLINNNFLTNHKLNEKYNDFPIHFIYESNKTEGSKIPFKEVENIIKEKKYTYKIKNEILEVENSIKVWDFINNKFIFNLGNIKKLYHLLTLGLLQENGLKYPRGFKKVNVVVNNNITTNHENVEVEVNRLISYYKNNLKTENPLKLAFDFHLKYEQIHPFENGNGRTGRFLLNKILLSNGLLPMIVYEENRKSYFNAIDSTKSGNKKKYYKFMLEQYNKTLIKYWKI